MTAKFYVYEHWRSDRNECFYVGKGHGKRANDMRRGRNRFHKAIQQKLSRIGCCVEVRIVADRLTEEEAFALEIERIAFWRNDGADLANMTIGGEGPSGLKHTEEWKKAISEKLKGRKHTPEAKAKMSAAAMGNKRGLGSKKSPEAIERTAKASRGKSKSEETKRKISETKLKNPTLKGRKIPHEVIEKRRLALLGHSVSIETREKLRQANLGKTHSEETRKRLSEIAKADWARRKGVTAMFEVEEK